MKYIAIAAVEKSDSGWYDISFPSFPGAHAQAQSLGEVQKEAESALCDFLDALVSVGECIPEADEFMNTQLEPGQMATIVIADMDAYHRKLDNRTVKKTVSLPAWMASGAEKTGLSLSKVLQDALRYQLNPR